MDGTTSDDYDDVRRASRPWQFVTKVNWSCSGRETGLMMMNLGSSMVVEESVADSLAEGGHDANVSDVYWRATKRVGVSSGASDCKTMMLTNAFDLLCRRC